MVRSIEGGRFDFRLVDGETVNFQAEYRPEFYDVNLPVPLRLETPSTLRRNSYEGPIPLHLTRAQASYLPAARPGAVALDLGCGRGHHREILEALDYVYYGVDYSGEAASDLVDAHVLPYKDGAFATILSIAVLEHLANPHRALTEVARVLVPGGTFVGTVAFLEPFHDNSFFHFSHLGLWYALRTAGFKIEVISPILGWDVSRAQMEMEAQSGLPNWVRRAFSAPLRIGLEAYGLFGRLLARDKSWYALEHLRARHAGGFFFAAQKTSG